jgi:hypothetical protein
MMNLRYALRDFGDYVEDRATTLHWSAEDGLKCRCSCDVCQSQWWKPIQFLLGLHPVVQTLDRVTSDKHYRDEDFDAAYDKLQTIYQVRITDYLQQKSHGFSSWCNSFYREKTTWYFEYVTEDYDRSYYEASDHYHADCTQHQLRNALETDTNTLIPLPRGEDIDVSNLPPNIKLYDTKPEGFDHLHNDEVWVTDDYLERTLHRFVEYV